MYRFLFLIADLNNDDIGPLVKNSSDLMKIFESSGFEDIDEELFGVWEIQIPDIQHMEANKAKEIAARYGIFEAFNAGFSCHDTTSTCLPISNDSEIKQSSHVETIVAQL